MSKLTHIDDDNRPAMVDVSEKQATAREAIARSVVYLPEAVLSAVRDGEIDSKKGPVFATAIIAGVMAAKKTHELIPFCHPLGLENCDVDIRLEGDTAVVECRCKVQGTSGCQRDYEGPHP